MSEIELYLLEYDNHKDEASRIAGQAATRLENKDLKLVSLIELLGEYLNNDDASIRTKTIFFLADVLSVLPVRAFSRQQRNLLCDFVLSRIADDPEAIEPLTRSLAALESMGKWEDERASQVFMTLLDSTNPLKQFKLQKQRYAILQLINLLMGNYRKALHEAQSSAPELKEKMVFYFDGEKDPRNLMIVFSVLLVPMTEWDVSVNAQDFFEAVFNYFPITFKPPPDDPYGITAQQLKDRLRDCISATSFFAPFAFPALLDKLDSTSANTKRDALQAISACIRDYSTRTISLYAVTLWDALKFEILNVQEEELAEEALNALADIAAKLSRTSDLSSYLKPVSKECNEHLEDAPTKQSQASGRIIEAIAKASPEASNFLTRAIVPQIISLFSASESLSKRRALIDVNIRLLYANVAVFGEWRTSDPEFLQKTITLENAFQNFSLQIQDLLLGAVVNSPKEEVSYRVLCIKGLIELVKIRSLLEDQEISKILQRLTKIILNEPIYQNDDLRSAAEAGLLDVAHQKPQLIVNEALPLFLAELPEDSPTDGSPNLRVLAAFAKLSSEAKIFETIVMRLKNRLTIAFQRPASGTVVVAFLNALLYAFVHGAYKDLSLDSKNPYHRGVVQWLFEQLQNNTSTLQSLAERATIFNTIGRICRIVLHHQDTNVQQETANRMYNLADLTQSTVLDTDGPPERRDLLLISTHILAALRTDVDLPSSPTSILRQLMSLIRSDRITPEVTRSALSQMSLIVNKHIPENDMKATLDESSLNRLDQTNFTNADILDIRVEFAISKALLLRNSRLASTKISALLQLLPDATHGVIVARGFSTLLAPDEFLTAENHCRISKLHQQKLFSLAIPVLTSAHRTAPPLTKKNYLLALAGLLHWLPYQLLMPELPALVPLLLQSLDPALATTTMTAPASSPDTFLHTSALNALTSVLTHDPEELSTHAHSLAARLLAIASSRSEAHSDAPEVRRSALACLALVPKRLRREALMPLRGKVVRELTGALDDVRRDVRREAVRCRVAWIALDEEE
ncbi:MAG: hypothetical protein M1821_002782 [Bathelium mastoideum]|nr:MAG: hypothetical protein M1821_002782 [Bathelium mastoideum]